MKIRKKKRLVNFKNYSSLFILNIIHVTILILNEVLKKEIQKNLLYIL